MRYLATREPEDGEEALPRLVRRRSLTYNVSLLLVLLRKRMVEFESSGEEGKLVLTRDPDGRDAARVPGVIEQWGSHCRSG